MEEELTRGCGEVFRLLFREMSEELDEGDELVHRDLSWVEVNVYGVCSVGTWVS